MMPAASDYNRAYWSNAKFDLTQKNSGSGWYSGNMCTRAAYSMSLSYLGVDCTPIRCSELCNARDLNQGNWYADVTNKLNAGASGISGKIVLEKKGNHPSNEDLQNMYAKYVSDTRYSPIVVYFSKPNGRPHAVVLVGMDTEGNYLFVDPSYSGIPATHAFKAKLNMADGQMDMGVSEFGYSKSKIGSIVQWHIE